MTPLAAFVMLGSLAVAGAVTISRVVSWSFSTARRHRIEAKAYAKTARHRAARRVA